MDEDEIYVDIVPRLDENAANEIETSLKEKFKNATQDIGGDFLDALKNSDIGEDFLGKLGEKVGDALSGPLKGIGDTLGLELQRPLEKLVKQDLGAAFDDVFDQLGSKVGKVLTDPLHGIADSIGIDLDNAVSKALNKDWTGLGDQLKHDVGDKLTDVLGVNELLGTHGLDDVIDKVHTVADTMKSLKSGDLGGALEGANALTGGAVQPLADLHDQIKKTVGDTKETVEELAGAGFLGSRLKGSAGLLAEAGAPVAAATALYAPVEDQLNKLPWVQEHFDLPGTGGDWFKKPFRELGGDIMHPSRLLSGDHLYDKNGNYIGPGAAEPAQPNSTDRLYNSVFGSEPAVGGGGKSSTTANVAEVEAGSAVVQAGSVTLSGGISLPAGLSLSGGGASSTGHAVAPSSGIARAGGDSGSMASLYSGSTNSPFLGHHADGGIVGYFDGGGSVPGADSLDVPGSADRWKAGNFNPNVQLDPSTTAFRKSDDEPWPWYKRAWNSIAGDLVFDKDQGGNGASKYVPDFAKDWLSDHFFHRGYVTSESSIIPSDAHFAIGGPSGTDTQPAWLTPGEFVIKKDSVDKYGKDFLAAINSGYFADGGDVAPPADVNNPTLSTPPSDGQPPHTGNAPMQQQSLGHGQGVGVSGGGILGAAEQAGVAAAGVAGFGGGAIAAQIAEQEMNLAIQKGGQMAATMAAAPFEEFGLGGGMMGAPTVNVMGGWLGKFVSGAMGQMNNLPNLAGSVQPPKQPQQKPEDQEQGQGQGERVSMQPAGTKDDPMHVNVTNQPAPQQGSATSAMNAMPGLTMAAP